MRQLVNVERLVGLGMLAHGSIQFIEERPLVTGLDPGESDVVRSPGGELRSQKWDDAIHVRGGPCTWF